jgi:hypothetical protein
MATATLPLTIPANQALSDSLSVGVLKAVRIGMPSDWDSAPLTFLISLDGATWLDLYYAAETTTGMWQPFETGLFSVIPNSIVLLPQDAGLNVPWLKLRSGTRSKPINQSAERVFSMVFGD